MHLYISITFLKEAQWRDCHQGD